MYQKLTLHLTTILKMKTHHIIIIIAMTIFSSCTTIKKIFNNDLKANFVNAGTQIPILTPELMDQLPHAVKNHLTVCGYANKEMPMNARWIWSESKIRMKPDSKWMKLNTSQYNSVEQPFRIALMKTYIAGIIPFEGRDLYSSGYGNMLGKLMKGITVINAHDKETAISAGIILLAEALMVPGYAFQNYIQWEHIDERTAKARFTDQGIAAEAIFHFDENGLLCHYHTLDRYYPNDDKTYRKVPYSVYINDYKSINGYLIPTRVSAVWHLEQGDYEYWVGTIEEIQYNINL
jgi:hypothetical protein